MNINCVVIGGNLTRDPELRYTAQGQAVCDLNIAINREWTDKSSGERKKEVSFVEVVAWGKTAELSAEHLKKGSGVLVEGMLKQDRWETPEGKKQSKTKVTAMRVHFVGGKPELKEESNAQEDPAF